MGLLGAGFAALMPVFLLDYLKARRQTAMRRALPDALDVIVVSLGGGLPVAASFRRVASELAGIHPLLASEMTIVQREVQMGRSLGQAMHHLAMRFDLDDLRSMASVIQQSERYGASVTRAFQIFSDGLRASRIQKAEETARKASVKLVFPTVLFIFPVMFVVILAPAFIQLATVLRSFNTQVRRSRKTCVFCRLSELSRFCWPIRRLCEFILTHSVGNASAEVMSWRHFCDCSNGIGRRNRDLGVLDASIRPVVAERRRPKSSQRLKPVVIGAATDADVRRFAGPAA